MSIKTVITDTTQNSSIRVKPAVALGIILTSIFIAVTLSYNLISYLTSKNQTRLRGANERALTIWQQVLKDNPKNFTGLINLAGIYIEENNYSGALDLLKKAEEVNPRSWKVQYNRGVIYLGEGKITKAQIEIEKIIKNNPQNYLAIYQLGIIAIEKGEWSRGKDLIQKSLPYSSVGSPEAYYNLGFCYQKLGIEPKAKAAYLRALEYQPNFQKAKIALDKLAKGG